MKKSLFVVALISSAAIAGETTICPNMPNSTVRDYRQPCMVIKDGKAYQTRPESTVQDYSKPTYTISKDGTVYQNMPNSSVRDYSKPTSKIEKK